MYTFGCPVNRTLERANPTLLKKSIYVVLVIQRVCVMTKQHREYTDNIFWGVRKSQP